MAKAAGRRVPFERETAPKTRGDLLELAARLEDLAQAQQEARRDVILYEPNYAVAFDRLFAAVAGLNPLYAAGMLHALACV